MIGISSVRSRIDASLTEIRKPKISQDLREDAITFCSQTSE
jgi:hypothetical protein